MKLFKLIIFILIVFFLKTKTLFSENNLFNVNNIQVEKKDKITNKVLADKAIKGFNQLLEKILLKKDIDIFSNLSFSSIKQLVIYYQVGKISDEENTEQLVIFNITFDKEKIHDLFLKEEFYTLKFQIKICMYYLSYINLMKFLFLIIIFFMKSGMKFMIQI